LIFTERKRGGGEKWEQRGGSAEHIVADNYGKDKNIPGITEEIKEIRKLMLYGLRCLLYILIIVIDNIIQL